MTFLSHAALGGMVYATSAHAMGVHPEISGAAFTAGAVLGVLPDALPWAVRILTDRRDLEELLRDILHRPAGPVRAWLIVLVAPYLHVLADQFIHAPRLPDPGTSPWYDRAVIGRITVRDALWCAGELALWVVVAALVLLCRSI